MPCIVCGNSKTIEAHIVPKAFARDVRGNAAHNVYITPNDVRKAQLGVFDPNILCAKCDNVLGEYDKYGIEFCRSFDEKTVIDSSDIFHTADADCEKFSRFILSILWRASVSSRIECKAVLLGPYEKVIQQVIFNVIGLDVFPAFDLMLVRWKPSQLAPHRSFTMPNRGRYLNGNSYGFLLMGFRIAARLDKRPIPIELRPFSINKSGIMQGAVGDYNQSIEAEGIRKMAKSYVARGQIR